MESSNALVCTVTGAPNANFSISGSGLEYNSSGRTLTTFSGNLGALPADGTVLTLSNGSTTYTPGPAAAVKATIDGVAPTDPTYHFIAGDPVRSLAVVALDASGVITPATFTVTPSGVAAGSVSVGGSGNAFTLTAGDMTDTVGALAIDLTPSAGNATGSISADFALGAPAAVTLSSVDSSVLWGTVAPAVANTTTTVTATVKNQNNLALPGVAVTFANPKAPSNTWSASPGTCFTAISNGGDTDASGQVTATFNPPDAKDAVLTAGEKLAKGDSSLTATSGSVTSTAVVVAVGRPLGSIVIGGPSRLDVGTLSGDPSAIGATTSTSFLITGAQDVDTDSVPVPAGSPTWAVTNVDLSGNNVGNTGDSGASSSSVSTINASTGRVTAGNSAGQITVNVTIGSTTSNDVTTEVYGIPSRIFLAPDTAASAIPSARGEYLFANVGDTQPFSFAFKDSAGHSVAPGEVSGLSSIATIQALTGGSITTGGSGVVNFTVTCGNVDGLFTLTVTGNWTGPKGGTGSINLNRSIGQNAP